MDPIDSVIMRLACNGSAHLKIEFGYPIPRPPGSHSHKIITPQPLYNTIVGVQANFGVSYSNCAKTRVKYIDKKQK